MSGTVADSVAAALLRHGITSLFGQSLPTALMLAAERIGIRQVFYRTENAAGAMADAFARISNQVTAVGAQNGPAATLLVPPMAEALKASIPLIALVQEVPAAVRDRNAFQELDHFTLFAGVSKWTRRLDDPARVEDYVDMAVTAANSGRPGPVVLLLPRDVLDMPAVGPRFPRTQDLGTFPLDRQRPDAVAVERAAAMLVGARSPLVVAGGGVHLSDASAALARLQAVASLPVVTTNMGKGAVDETAPLSIGVAANVTGRNGPAHFALPLIEEADVVLLVGTRTNENGTDGWTLTSPDATYIHIDVDSLEVGRTYEAVRLVGDARAALTDLTAALERLDLSARTAAAAPLARQIAAAKEQHRDRTLALRADAASPVRPERLLAELDDLLGPDDIVVADASYSSIWVTTQLTARAAGQRFLTPRGLAGLGWGLPMAIGAKVARPGAKVVALVGDGGFAHVWGELETCVRENLPVVVLVLNNGLLGYQRHAENYFYGQTTSAIDFAEVDHAAVAAAVGCRGVLVTDPADLPAVLREALESPRATVVDVRTEPDSYAPARVWDSSLDRINGTPTVVR